MEENAVDQTAVDDEGVEKFTTALDNLRARNVTVKKIDPAEQTKMAQAVEPWLNEKADEYNARGYPGDETFRRLIDLAQQNGATPVHVHDIK